MTYKNAKTILFAGLIAAMILPFSGMMMAEAAPNDSDKYEPTEVSDAIKAITPYVALNENGLAEFTTKKSDIPLDKRTIKIASDYMELQNSFSKQAKEHPDKQVSIDSKLIDKFSKFADDIKQKKSKSPTNTSGFDWILPEAFAWGEVCGGAPWNPQPEPPVYELYNSVGAVNYLLGDGYHLVEAYATLHLGDDYAKVISEFGCGNGEIRAQGLVQSEYVYNSQSPEPNPEINSYTAPVWWWDGYVFVWHWVN